MEFLEQIVFLSLLYTLVRILQWYNLIRIWSNLDESGVTMIEFKFR